MTEEAKPKVRLQLLGGTLVRSFKTEEVGGWPSMEGTVRPATPAEVRGYLATMHEYRMKGPENADAQVHYQAGFFAGLLKSWNVYDGDRPAEINAAAVMQLPSPVYDQLENIVLGYATGELLKKSDASSGSP